MWFDVNLPPLSLHGLFYHITALLRAGTLPEGIVPLFHL